MAKINFYLKNPNDKNPSLIYLTTFINAKKFKFSTGQKIHPKFWNFENQRLKKNCSDSAEMNDFLEGLATNLNRILLTARTAGREIVLQDVREKLIKSIQRENITTNEFHSVINEYYEIRRDNVSPNYLKNIKTLINHLYGFEKKRKYKLSFERIDLNFYDKFVNYLQVDKGHFNDSWGKYISVLKTFLNWAVDRKRTNNIDYKKFKFEKSNKDIVHLTESELFRLFEFDLSNNPRLLKVRELFCFACFTGLRFSDFVRITKDNIRDGQLHLTTKKSRGKSESLSIPINDYADEILKRNNYELTKISNQKMNDYMKELCKLVEINEPIITTRRKGSEAIETTLPKYEHIGTHAARRTFITLSLERGMRAEVVMKITGHSDYRTFKKYINLTDKIKKNEMTQAWSRQRHQMKVAS